MTGGIEFFDGVLGEPPSLRYLYYNFARPRKTICERCPRTLAMAAGVSDHVWTCEEIAALLD